PCEAVKVVASAPVERAPWSAPAAPASLCISATEGTEPQRFGRPSAAQASASSPIGEEGVSGEIAVPSLAAYAIRAAASFPSMASRCDFRIMGGASRDASYRVPLRPARGQQRSLFGGLAGLGA